MDMSLPAVPPMMLVDSGALNEAEGQETHGRGRGGGPVFHVRGGCAAWSTLPCPALLRGSQSYLLAAMPCSWAPAPLIQLVLRSTCLPTCCAYCCACCCARLAGLCLTEEYSTLRTVLRIPGGNPFSVRQETVQVGPTRTEVTGILVSEWVSECGKSTGERGEGVE